MSIEATWLHLQQAHGFYDWSDQDLAERYRGLVREDGAVDVAGLHERDHQVHADDLDHQHEPGGGRP
jgi:hypothetical protein